MPLSASLITSFLATYSLPPSTSLVRRLPLIATDCHLLPLIASLTAAECVPHQVVREYDEVSRLDAQKTTMLLAVKKKIKEATDDIT